MTSPFDTSPVGLRCEAVKFALNLTAINQREPDAEVLVIDAGTIYGFLKDGNA